MPMNCPTCGTPIEEADINVGADVAFCRTCDVALKLSSLARSVGAPGPSVVVVSADTTVPPVDLSRPPAGCVYSDNGQEAVVTASCRGPVGWVFLFFSGVWNLVTWSMVIAMGAQKNVQVFDALFMLPFIAIGMATAIPAVMGLFGHVRLRVRGEVGEVFVGAFGAGWKRQFVPAEVTTVTVEDSGTRVNGRPVPHIIIRLLGKKISFGTMLGDERRLFVRGAIGQLLGR